MTTKLYRGSGVKDAHTEINPVLTGIEKERTPHLQCIQVKQRPSNKQQEQNNSTASYRATPSRTAGQSRRRAGGLSRR